MNELFLDGLGERDFYTNEAMESPCGIEMTSDRAIQTTVKLASLASMHLLTPSHSLAGKTVYEVHIWKNPLCSEGEITEGIPA